MIRGILRNGVIEPLDPLPADWTEGTEVQVEEATNGSAQCAQSFDRWREEMEALAAQIDPEDIRRMDAALDEADREAKDFVRRQMGL